MSIVRRSGAACINPATLAPTTLALQSYAVIFLFDHMLCRPAFGWSFSKEAAALVAAEVVAKGATGAAARQLQALHDTPLTTIKRSPDALFWHRDSQQPLAGQRHADPMLTPC